MSRTRSKRTKQPALQSQSPSRTKTLIIILGIIISLAISATAGYLAGRHSAVTVPPLADSATVAQAKQDITKAYLASSIKNCTDTATGRAFDGPAYFQQYLKVNAYADRATIRSCNTNGELLAKLHDKWVVTQVNLNLSARANPVWARACWVSDILEPDSVVRPENNSIDSSNLTLCQALQHGHNLDILGKEIK